VEDEAFELVARRRQLDRLARRAHVDALCGGSLHAQVRHLRAVVDVGHLAGERLELQP
jgi:hypothetical protein